MNDALKALEDQYFTVRGSLSALMAQGATPAQLDDLRTQIVMSRNNYWTAINKVLHDDDPQVAALTSQMNGEQLTLQASIDHLADVARILDVITRAVNIGTQLAAKAIAF